MSLFRFIAIVLLLALCSCDSSKRASRKRRRMAPCDCPGFNYVPKTDRVYKVYACDVTDVVNVTDTIDA